MFKYYGLLFLIVILVIILFFPTVREKFSLTGQKQKSFYLDNGGIYPSSVTLPILTESYPYTGNKNVSNNNVSDIWFHYPIFSLPTYGSLNNDFAYKQITNNIKYNRNPDDGVCSRAEFCGALYHDNQLETNYSKILPPAPTVTPDSVRIGYYIAKPNKFLGNQLGPELPTF
jgi:hypothetical protein